jgi:hypothetical protein
LVWAACQSGVSPLGVGCVPVRGEPARAGASNRGIEPSSDSVRLKTKHQHSKTARIACDASALAAGLLWHGMADEGELA